MARRVQHVAGQQGGQRLRRFDEVDHAGNDRQYAEHHEDNAEKPHPVPFAAPAAGPVRCSACEPALECRERTVGRPEHGCFPGNRSPGTGGRRARRAGAKRTESGPAASPFRRPPPRYPSYRPATAPAGEPRPTPPRTPERRDEPVRPAAGAARPAGRDGPRPDCGEGSYRGHGRLAGKSAIITGGDSGIGRAVAIAYAREGADVLISYLSEDDDARDTAQWVQRAGRRAVLVHGDVADAGHCRRIVDEAVSAFGKVDILVNNAAFQMTHPALEEISDEE
jgi:hypothetical protein